MISKLSPDLIQITTPIEQLDPKDQKNVPPHSLFQLLAVHVEEQCVSCKKQKSTELSFNSFKSNSRLCLMFNPLQFYDSILNLLAIVCLEEGICFKKYKNYK